CWASSSGRRNRSCTTRAWRCGSTWIEEGRSSTMSDNWTARLSEYLDETLAPAERQGLAAHLTNCAECRATLDELRQVVARARALEDRSPRADLWPAVATRIGVVSIESRRRRFSFTVPQLLAAGIALAVISAGGAWLALPRPATTTGRRLIAEANPRGRRRLRLSVSTLRRH